MCRKVIISRNDDNNDAFLLIYLHQSLLLSRLVGIKSTACMVHRQFIWPIFIRHGPAEPSRIRIQDERPGKKYRYEMPPPQRGV